MVLELLLPRMAPRMMMKMRAMMAPAMSLMRLGERSLLEMLAEVGLAEIWLR